MAYNNITCGWFFGALTSIAAALGLQLQEFIFIIIALAGLAISLANFLYGRMDAARKNRNEEKRTAIIREYLNKRTRTNNSEM